MHRYKDRLTSEEEKADHLESQLAALSKTDKTRQGREKNLENVIESLRQSAKDADAANEARLNEFTRCRFIIWCCKIFVAFSQNMSLCMY